MREKPPAEVVVITGATAGVGRATARAFAKSGAHVAVLARGRDGLLAAAREIEAEGARALAIATDVADPAQVEAAAAQVERTLGPIDIWVNNATTSVFSPVKDMKPIEFKRVTDVTYLGYVYGTLAALRRMLPRDRGVIVQVQSARAQQSMPLQSAYCAAKHAVHGFTKSLISELLHDDSHVRVTMVQLPAMNTPLFDWAKSRLLRKPRPLPPIFQPEVAARAIVRAAHDRQHRDLTRVNYDELQTGEPADANANNNLWVPVPGDHGAHGRFDLQSRDHSAHLWLSLHRRGIALAAAATVAAGGFALLKRRG